MQNETISIILKANHPTSKLTVSLDELGFTQAEWNNASPEDKRKSIQSYIDTENDKNRLHLPTIRPCWEFFRIENNPITKETRYYLECEKFPE